MELFKSKLKISVKFYFLKKSFHLKYENLFKFNLVLKQFQNSIIDLLLKIVYI
jgi:hypothetical protein